MITKNTVCIVTRTNTAPGAVSLYNASLSLGLSVQLSLLGSEGILNDIQQAEFVFYRIGPKYYTDYQRLATNLTGAAQQQLQAVLQAFDKIESHKILSRSGAPVPLSESITEDFSDYYSFPFVLKVPRGNRGEGVELVSNDTELATAKRDLFSISSTVLMQEYVAESRGSDKRIIVAGGQVVASMLRTAADGDFRANLHQGGSGTVYSPSSEEARIAVAACDALGLQFAGVDIIDSSRGPLVLEVNPSPGLALSSVVGFDVAQKVIKTLVDTRKG